MSMEIHFWGVRGSIATPLSNAELNAKIESVLKLGIKQGLTDPSQIAEFVDNLPEHIRYTAGGDSSCVQVKCGDKLLILDAGSGIRPLGNSIKQQYGQKPIEIHILLSHTHWDHICGFPFFEPAYNPNAKVLIYGVHSGLRERLEIQQLYDYFPVPFGAMKSNIEFIQLKERTSFNIGDVVIDTLPLVHPGGSHSYRITHNGKTVVFATDSEFKELPHEPALKRAHFSDRIESVVDFFKSADLLIFDAQYTFLESVIRENWGHSNVFLGIDLALEARVKKIAFTHHEPTYSDEKLWGIFQKAEDYLEIHPTKTDLQLVLAYEGLEIVL